MGTHAQEWIAVLALVLFFLIIEIPLVCSIFKNESKADGPAATEK